MKINSFGILLLIFFSSCENREVDRGTVEVEKMFNDRPQMRVDASTKLYREAAKTFQNLRWSNDLPEINASEFTLDGEVRVRENISTGEAWTVFFFEKFNSTGKEEFEDLWRRGNSGELSRTEWVRENVKLEYRAAQEFVIFMDTLLIPEFQTLGISTEEAQKYRESFLMDMESWMNSPQDCYPWNYWGK